MNTISKYLTLTALALLFCWNTGMAQVGPEERAEKIKAYRVAVFTETLNLSAEEAQGFWPIYNEYLDKREELTSQRKPSKQIDGMNDAEVEDYIKKHFELQARELDLEKDLVQKLRKVLPVRKIAKLPVAEREFREALVKKLQELRQQKRMERRPGRQ
jgi:hypothetical protein